MDKTYLFYDLETSGLNARSDRIMQFAGQRTDMDLNPIGDPINLLVKLNDDTLPSPYAILVTGITPQKTQLDGLSEAEFCKYITKEIFTPGTIATGYNSVRFDDEFMRHLFWRNFYDPYEWQWKDGRSRWDLLDVIRLTRALRPEGINWPVDKDGKATNRLELITKLNGISHEAAHDALSDVTALIDVAKLIKSKQPKLYDYLLKMRDKKEVQNLANLENPQPFVYTSGRLSAEHNKTTVVYPLAPAPHGNLIVFDLRYNLDEVLENNPKYNPFARYKKGDESPFRNSAPIVKELKYNHCPAVAPLVVLEQDDGWAKIHLNREKVLENLAILQKNPIFAEQMRTNLESKPEFPQAPDPESALYDGFLDNADRTRCDAVRSAKLRDLADFHPEFSDPRLPELLNHYKARNYPDTMTEHEQAKWQEYREKRLNAQAPDFLNALEVLAKQHKDAFILEELRLWYQSLSA